MGAAEQGGDGGERASVERARWVQAAGASPTPTIRSVGLASTQVEKVTALPELVGLVTVVVISSCDNRTLANHLA